MTCRIHRKQSHFSIGIKTWLWSCCSGRGYKTNAFSEGKSHSSAWCMIQPPIIVSSTQSIQYHSTATNIICFIQWIRHVYFFCRSIGVRASVLKVWIGLKRRDVIHLTSYLLFYFEGNRFIIGTCSILCRSDYDGLSNVNMSSIRRAAIDVEYQCHDGLHCGDFLQ